MTGVALLDRSFDEASAPQSCGESRLPATSVAQKSRRHELFGLNEAKQKNRQTQESNDACKLDAFGSGAQEQNMRGWRTIATASSSR
jgi:hypothetical protein